MASQFVHHAADGGRERGVGYRFFTPYQGWMLVPLVQAVTKPMPRHRLVFRAGIDHQGAFAWPALADAEDLRIASIACII